MAKRLTRARDEYSSIDAEARPLDDDPSKRFEGDLSEEIAVFERGLRKVILLSACPEDRGFRSVEELERFEFREPFRNALC